jgi:hypothetical protein
MRNSIVTSLIKSADTETWYDVEKEYGQWAA